MGKILDFIDKEGEGRYYCYKTKKLSLDDPAPETLDYDDRPATSTSGKSIAESDLRRVETIPLGDKINKLAAKPLFYYFLDGSRHVYKVDDIAVGNGIYPFLAGQIIVGCCQRPSRDIFKKCLLTRKIVLSLPENFNWDEDKEADFCRSYCDKINEELYKNEFVKDHGIKIDKILLYKTDGNKEITQDRNGFKNSGTAKIQSEMTDEEQMMVRELCSRNLLDNDHYLIKDGSLEYNPSFTNLRQTEWNLLRSNYKHVVGVSKMFNPDLLKDFNGHKLSKTIANLKPFERTKVYRYQANKDYKESEFAIWYVRLRKSDYRETHFSDVVKCEMVLEEPGASIDTDLVNIISANIIREAFPVCYGKDSRWANHLYPVFLTETYCKSNYLGQDILLNLF
jgi:hypothetical protein